MRIKRISFYDNFKCLGSSCPDCCCKGWIIPLDDETVAKYRSLPLKIWLKVCLSIGKINGNICFNKNSLTCPFLTKEKLCFFQKKYGEEYLCKTCAEYPRYLCNYGDFAKEMLDLSCPEAARLFLDNINNISYTTIDGNVTYEKTATNDEPDLLLSLEKSEDLLSEYILSKNNSLYVIWQNLIDYGCYIQESFIKDANSKILNKDYTFGSKIKFTPSMLSVDKIVYTRFFHKKLKKTDPELYRLFKLYEKKFKNATLDDSDRLLNNLIDELSTYYKDADSLIRSYCAYYLKCMYLSVYNDYSFRKHLSMCVLHSYMFALLLYLHADNKGSLDSDDIIKIICAYDKRARHNPQVSDEMYLNM